MASQLVSGDTGSSIVVTVRRSDGSVFDLTGCSAVLVFNIDRGRVLATRTVDMTILGAPTDGKLTYQFAPDDLPTLSGGNDRLATITGEVRITDSLSRELTSVGPRIYATLRNRMA